jgi:hypothetical protein
MRETSLPQYLRFFTRAPTVGAKDEEGDNDEEMVAAGAMAGDGASWVRGQGQRRRSSMGGGRKGGSGDGGGRRRYRWGTNGGSKSKVAVGREERV